MHTLIGILTALGAIAIWVIRAVNAARAAAEVARTVNDLKNRKRRTGGANTYGDGTLETLNDPRVAAFGILHAIVNEDSVVTAEKINAIDENLMNILGIGPKEAEDLSSRAQDYLKQSSNLGAVTDRFANIIFNHCTPRERADFCAAMKTVINTGPDITDNAKSAVQKVQQRLT